MSTMYCAKCHLIGIYWKNLGGINEYTFCPNCGGVNCQQVEIENEEEEEG